MDKEIVTLQSLMDDAGTYYTNLVSSGSWKLESGKNAQIIALTTQLSALKTELQSLSKNVSDQSKGSVSDKSSSSTKNYGNFEAWRLTKVNKNGAEFNMVEKYGKKYFWCDQHQYPQCNTSGMNVFHKPTEHDAWKAQKDELNKKRGKKTSGITPATTASSATVPSNAASTASTKASKLSLAKSLQEALTTTAGLTKDQFQKIWKNCCDASGNQMAPIVGLRL